jgi:O-antigen/teichoic acid export membrane protein
MSVDSLVSTARVSTAPLSGWRRMFVDWIVVSGATIVTQVLGVLSSIVLRMALSPAQMGVWQALKLLLANGNYANLGISKGAAREFTIALGRGDPGAAQHGLNLAFTVNTISSGLFGAALVAGGLWIGCCSGGVWHNAWAVGLIVIGVLAVLQRYVTFQVTLLRSKQDFANTSQLSILEAVLTVAAVGPAAWFGGLSGLYAGTLAVLVASLWFLHTHGALRLTWAWDRAEIRRLVSIGSPIMLAGVVSTLFRTLDKLMILGYLPDREFQLGCYSLALLVTGQLYGLGNMLAIVIGPRLGEHYGYWSDRRAVARLTSRSSELQAAAAALPAALAIVAAGPLLGAILPDYRMGLAPMLWLIPGVIALVLALLPGQYLVAVDRQNWSLAATLLATALAAAGNHLALVGGYGLVGVAIATSASYVIYFLVQAALVWVELDLRERLRGPAMHLLAVAPALILALALEWLRPTPAGQWMPVVAKIAAVTAAWGMSLAVGWHSGGWRETMRRNWHAPARSDGVKID